MEEQFVVLRPQSLTPQLAESCSCCVKLPPFHQLRRGSAGVFSFQETEANSCPNDNRAI